MTKKPNPKIRKPIHYAICAGLVLLFYYGYIKPSLDTAIKPPNEFTYVHFFVWIFLIGIGYILWYFTNSILSNWLISYQVLNGNIIDLYIEEEEEIHTSIVNGIPYRNYTNNREYWAKVKIGDPYGIIDTRIEKPIWKILKENFDGPGIKNIKEQGLDIELCYNLLGDAIWVLKDPIGDLNIKD